MPELVAKIKALLRKADARSIEAVDAAIGALPGSTKARHEIVAMSKEYLESLAPNPRDDQELALEVSRCLLDA